jgi:uncharacterized protein YbjT (DUF2867 family)
VDLSETYQFPYKKALIIGASGLIGRELTDLLLQSSQYQEVLIFVRKPLDIQHPKLTQIIYHFDRPDTSLIQADDIYCALGSTIKKAGSKEAFRKIDFEYPLQIATAGLQNGTSQFLIVTALGSDPDSMIFYNRVKGEVELALEQTGYQSLHIFRPSLLTGNRTEKRSGEDFAKVLAKVIDPLLRGPLRKYRSIKGKQVAQAMLRIATMQIPGTHRYDSDEIHQLSKQ